MTMTTIVALDTMMVLVSISVLLNEKNEALNKIKLLLIIVVVIAVVGGSGGGSSSGGGGAVSCITFRH